MRFVKLTLIALVAILLVFYAFDCEGVTTPEQANQCCDSMPCSPQSHHGQDCCKSMPSMHAPFLQPSAGRSARVSLDALDVLRASSEPIGIASSARNITSHWHAPPGLLPQSPLPLRI